MQTYVLTGKELNSLMRRNKVTIREFKSRTGITLKRLREVLKTGLTSEGAARDWVEAIIGHDPGIAWRWIIE